MNAELVSFLKEIGIWVVIGGVAGAIIHWARPSWGRRWTKFVLNRQWKLFAFGAVFFGLGALVMWHDGRIYHAMTALALCLLEIFALVKYGFKRLTPEMEQRLDQA